ncbi:MAG: amidohydrolase family protein [Promethearchaeota archaeon]
MRTLIEAPFLLAGDNLELLKNAYVLIDNDQITEIGTKERPKSEKKILFKKEILIPGLINSHIHVGDSAFKDKGLGKSVSELFKPPNGLKHKLLENTEERLLIQAIKDSINDMLRCGTTTFADFREGSIKGAQLLLKALKNINIRALILGRPDHVFTKSEIERNQGKISSDYLAELNELFNITEGLALSSPNDITDEAMKQLADFTIKNNKFRAIHASEAPNSKNISIERSGHTEVERAINYFKTNLLVHLTYASRKDLDKVAKTETPVVICPRANASLGLKLPPITEMYDRGITVCLGTDNVMINQPNMFREMEFTFKAYRIERTSSQYPSPRDILCMATINGARALGIGHKTGSIKEGKSADIVIINMEKNLRNVNDIYSALVHRTGAEDILTVLLRGKFSYGYKI